MVICGQCGARNSDGEDFCGQCGAYLEWEGERVTPEAPEPVAEPVVEAAPVGTSPAATSPAATSPAWTSPAATSPASTSPAATSPAATSPAATSPVAPAPAEAGARQPAPVRPGAAAPKPRRQALPPEERTPQPGESICPSCGAGNVPTRKFCRRCGTDLVDAPVAARLPWYRRLFARRPDTGPAAGTRPGTRARRRRPRAPVVLAVVVALLAGGAYVGRSKLTPVIDAVRDRVQGTQPVNPKMSASSAAPGHGAALARDGATNRYWAPAKAGPGAGEYLQAALPAPSRLLDIRVHSGVSADPTAFLAQGRPKVMSLTMTRAKGPVAVKTVTLEDRPGPQDIDVAVSDVTAVRLTIVSSYAVPRGARVAIAEVELFARK